MAIDEEDTLLSEALTLSSPARARLARKLISSLNEAADPTAADAWLAEIDRRSAEVKAGTAVLHDWEVVREELRGRWRKR
jgi:putative addiction module component (TIGR02574 family)